MRNRSSFWRQTAAQSGLFHSLTFCRLAMGGLFSTKVSSENGTFGYHKTVKRRRNPAYCQCAVIARFISSILFHLYNVLCHLVGFSCRLYTLVLNDNESEILSDQQILRNSCQYYNHQVCVLFR